MPAIQIGRWSFPSKAAAERHIRAVLQRAIPMEPLTGEDGEFSHALFWAHPRAKELAGVGVGYICVQLVPENPQFRRFLLVRQNGTWYDFSWRAIVYPSDAMEEVANCCRHLIVGDILDYKAQYFDGECNARPCEGCRKVSTWYEVDVDHEIEFQQLLRRWMAESGLVPEAIAVQKFNGYAQCSRLSDPAVAASWQRFHRANAKLRCLCKECHARYTAEGARTRRLSTNG